MPPFRHCRNPRLLSVSLCALVLFGLASRPATADAADLEQKSARVDALFAGLVGERSPGCAVGVIENGRYVFQKGYGMANLAYDVPITAKTRFRLGSTSKQFTAAAIAILVRQGKVSLDDDIRSYLPELPDYGEKVTVANLVHHTSGLPGEYEEIGFKWQDWPDYYHEYGDFFTKNQWFGREEYLSNSTYLKRIASVGKLRFQPGSRYEYNNPGYFLLGQIVERVTGQTLRQFSDANIFKPLGMNDSFFNDRGVEVVANGADGYLTLPDGRVLIYNTDLDMVGEDGIYTTLEDFLRWDHKFYRNVLNDSDPGLIELMTTPDTHIRRDGPKDRLVYGSRYAFGLQIKDDGPRTVHFHSGWYVGFKSHARRYPQMRFSVVLMCNTPQLEPWNLAGQITGIFRPELGAANGL
jgi:CubicO group peptidase (beta-lactamase class C family)